MQRLIRDSKRLQQDLPVVANASPQPDNVDVLGTP
jgi:hypothetical protein